VSRDRQQVHAERHGVNRQVADGLARVGVEKDPRLPAQSRRLGDRLDRPDLVVGVLDRREQRARAPDFGGEGVQVERPVGITGTSTDSKPSVSSVYSTPPTEGCSTVVVITPRAELADRPDPAPDRQCDRFGPPLVKTISSGCEPSAPAIVARASSRSRRAAMPSPWVRNGSANSSSAASSAARARSSRGLADV
jgi:hypothetical protein